MNRLGSSAESRIVSSTIPYPTLNNLDDYSSGWVGESLEDLNMASPNNTISKPWVRQRLSYHHFMNFAPEPLTQPVSPHNSLAGLFGLPTLFTSNPDTKLADGFVVWTFIGNSSALQTVKPLFVENEVYELPKFQSQGPLAPYSTKYSMRNWDGYDADPITADTISAAEKILANLPDTFGVPDIAPGADGTIGLEWIFDKGPLRKLFIDIGPGNFMSVYWRRSTGESKTVPLKQIGQSIKGDLEGLFAELSV